MSSSLPSNIPQQQQQEPLPSSSSSSQQPQPFDNLQLVFNLPTSNNNNNNNNVAANSSGDNNPRINTIKNDKHKRRQSPSIFGSTSDMRHDHHHHHHHNHNHSGSSDDSDSDSEGDSNEDDIMPICRSYSDMEESLRAAHRHSRLKHWFIHWFYRRFIKGDDIIISRQQDDEQIENSLGLSDVSGVSENITTTTTNNVINFQSPEPINSSPKSINSDSKAKMQWYLNYLEASIYLEEGLNNDKFDHHPHLFTKLPMYLIAHNRFIYFIDFICCLLILLLALAEKPAADRYHLPESVHASIELIGLIILATFVIFKIQWIGMKKFFKHGRTLIKSSVLCLMIIEAIVVLLRQDSHFRLTRSLRPFFLIDNFYFYGVRRVIRQTIQSLRSFLDMLALLLFFLIFFTISAFYLFSSIPNYHQFSTIIQSFLSLFVLLTTANFPDVMMPAYQQHQFYALFFIVFLVVNLYFLLNIMLAVVYNAFSTIEKEKFRKLFLHRRKACDHAFRLLVTSKNVEFIRFKHFNGLLDHLKPESTQLERILMFKALVMEVFTPPEDYKHRKLPEDRIPGKRVLDTDEYLKRIIENKQRKNQRRRYNKNDVLTLKKFYHIYEVLNLKWKNLDRSKPWFDCEWKRFKLLNQLFCSGMYKLRSIVQHRYFEYFSYSIIFLAALYQFFDALIGWDNINNHHFDDDNNNEHFKKLFYLKTSTKTICLIFISLYTMEMLLKISTLGFQEYFRKRWNCFDFFITVISLMIFILNEYQILNDKTSTATTLLSTTSFYSFRSLKLLDFLRHHVKNYRLILGPFTFIILKRFISVTIVVLIIYYFFAIIAMEFFGKYSLIDCCKNTTLEPLYQFNGTTTSYYYLNNFQDLTTSYITLFELMVVNNWQITMKAYVIVTENRLSYLFFIAFYIITVVVVTIVVTFVLDTFNFHIEYKNRFGPNDSMSVKISIEVPLTEQEFNYYKSLDENYQSNRKCCSYRSPRLFPIMDVICKFQKGRHRMNSFKINDNDNNYINDYDDDNNQTSSAFNNRPRFFNITEEWKDFVSIVPSEAEMPEAVVKRTIMFRGQKIRDKFSYNLRMYHDKLKKWIEQSEFS